VPDFATLLHVKKLVRHFCGTRFTEKSLHLYYRAYSTYAEFPDDSKTIEQVVQDEWSDKRRRRTFFFKFY